MKPTMTHITLCAAPLLLYNTCFATTRVVDAFSISPPTPLLHGSISSSRSSISPTTTSSNARHVAVTPQSHTVSSTSRISAPNECCRRRRRRRQKTSSRVVLNVASAIGAEDDFGAADVDSTTKKATMPKEIFSLVKNIVGAGVLSLPAGVAAFGNAPSALLPATLLIASIGIISGYNFSLLGRISSMVGAHSFSDAWDKTVGKDSSWIVAATGTVDNFLSNVAYSMILADTSRSLIQTVTSGTMVISRTQSLLGVTSCAILPLCLLKNLSSLAPFSLLGILGMAYTAVGMALRFFSGAYKSPAGRFLADVPTKLQPSFGSTGATGAINPAVFILICMLSTSFNAHFNAPKFYNELENNTLKRYNTVVTTSFALSIAIFAAVSALGFLTFGSASSGLILNNYSTKDLLMSVSRFAVALSILFSYPIVFMGTRDGLLDLAKIPMDKRTNGFLNQITLGILATITALAAKFTDLSFIMSIIGALFGNSLIYIYPAIMFRSVVKKMKGSNKASVASLKREVKVSLAAACLGIVFGVIGATEAVKSLF